jgi:hypothetical protein
MGRPAIEVVAKDRFATDDDTLAAMRRPVPRSASDMVTTSVSERGGDGAILKIVVKP